MVCSAREVLRRGSGDCDDKVTLLCSLLTVAGYNSRFVAGGYAPDDFAHVWCEAELNGQWVALDPTKEDAAPGWFYPFPHQLVWEIYE
jgi:transglutaminase-like putative cysteine protease